MRAGRYIQQPSGYKAFIPKNLPPQEPPIQLNSELQSKLSAADRALGRLDGSIQTLPDPDLFVFMYVRKEAVLSSQIEGTQSSLNDVLKAEAKMLTSDTPKDVYEVSNYITAMNHGLTSLKDLPVSVRLIKEIHEKLLSDVRGAELEPGELRRSQKWIGSQGCSLNEALFIPPPPHEMELALSALELFIHSESDLPLLLKIGLIHAQFETIHPFLDGNGRVGRLLITFLLCEKEVLIKPVLYISHYFKKNRQKYYDLLQRVRDSGDWESWLSFFLEGVSEVSNEATETSRNIVSLRENDRAIIQSKFGRTAANGLNVLEQMYSSPFVSVPDIAKYLDISYTAANQLMDRFLTNDILEEVTGQTRNRVFRYSRYIGLFS